MTSCAGYLVGFGIVLLAAIYLWGRRGSRAVAPDERARPRARPEPSRQAPTHRRRAEPMRRARRSSSTRCRRSCRQSAELAPVPEPPADRRGAGAPRARAFADAPTDGDAVRPRSELRSLRRPTLSFERSAAVAARRAAQDPVAAARGAAARTLRGREAAGGAARRDPCSTASTTSSIACTTDGSIVFSVASMVEPGTFDLEKMGETLYPGITHVRAAAGTGAGHARARTSWSRCARRLQATLRRHVAGRARRAAHRPPDRAHAPGSARVRASAGRRRPRRGLRNRLTADASDDGTSAAAPRQSA